MLEGVIQPLDNVRHPSPTNSGVGNLLLWTYPLLGTWNISSPPLQDQKSGTAAVMLLAPIAISNSRDKTAAEALYGCSHLPMETRDIGISISPPEEPPSQSIKEYCSVAYACILSLFQTLLTTCWGISLLYTWASDAALPPSK